jgi:hypothetical protein
MGSGVTPSFSTINPGNFELTPCRVKFKGIDLGATLGNVKVTIKESLADLKSDQLGKTIIDRRVSGFEAHVETSIAENQLKTNWKVLFPAHKLVTNNVNQSSFYFDSRMGISMADLAGPLILHPLSRPDTDLSGDVLVYLAAANSASEYEFGPDKQIAMKIHWDMYPDFTSTIPRFMLFGDPSISAVPATAGAATAGTGNVGNGTVTGISVYDTTITQLVTLQCVTAGTAAEFYISGSVDGALGLAQLSNAFVGAANNLPQIGFTITPGASAFAFNDSFTIQTTGPNYV